MYKVINSNIEDYFVETLHEGHVVKFNFYKKPIEIYYYVFKTPSINIIIDNVDYINIINSLKLFYSKFNINLMLNINNLIDFKNIELLLNNLKILTLLKYKLINLLKYTTYITCQSMEYLFIYVFEYCKPIHL